ncbi:hypothetical protein ILYODFUR_025532 [Ilyodon furcidens]|uniref:Uncharacterized protein n=1 Tax=Ilyodon furcidens TaxID=33524 RepID=A0ABV0T2C4_9TELE
MLKVLVFNSFPKLLKLISEKLPQDFIYITGHILSGNGGGKNPWQTVSRLGMSPHLCHHRLVPWLAGDLPWCKVGIHIPSTAMRRRILQWGSGKGSTMEGKY